MQIQQQLQETRERTNKMEHQLRAVMNEKQLIQLELQAKTEELQQLMREKEQSNQTSNRGEDEQQVSDIIVTLLYKSHTLSYLLSFHRQLSDMTINEGREETPHWVVRREEVDVTSEVVGRGGWGEVRVAKFRGLRLAAKYLYQVILSDYNLRQFTREMTIAAKLRHPNLLLFIGATREGEPVILTELMPTSLRRELERREMPRVQITSICHDLARALCYLHQWKPYPIIHRDISSGNVLLEPLPNGWRAKVSDYGSANFMNLVSTTVGPGNPFYAAPEASYPHQHSPKMDTYSFGVLLVEMSLRELPESRPERREEQIQRIQWPAMVSLIRSCTSETSAERPSMSDIMELLDRVQISLSI